MILLLLTILILAVLFPDILRAVAVLLAYCFGWGLFLGAIVLVATVATG